MILLKCKKRHLLCHDHEIQIKFKCAFVFYITNFNKLTRYEYILFPGLYDFI
jgi:hypothetical protein